MEIAQTTTSMVGPIIIFAYLYVTLRKSAIDIGNTHTKIETAAQRRW